jgi:putative redox protein
MEGHMTAIDPTAAAAAQEPGWVIARAAGTGAGFRTEISAGRHGLTADEPASVGGGNAGPSPYDLLLAAIGACTAMTVRMYAARKGWPLEEVVVAIRTRRSHAADCAECAEHEKELPRLRLERRVELRGPLSDEQRTRILTIADRCPVKQALQHGIVVHAEP